MASDSRRTSEVDSPPHSDPDFPHVTTSAGTFRGRRDGAVIRVRGIRYAHAERFAAPTPVAGVSVASASGAAVFDATNPSPACPQVIDPEGLLRVDGLIGLDFSEDCLRVSVTIPTTLLDRDQPLQEARLPVLVWIHGGAYRGGAADSALYDPAPLVAENNVVVVSVGYRLGVLGYLPGVHGPANLGLLDQLEALRWVRRHIADFGGDPDLVTVMGESAGADAVAHLMISHDPVAEPLFRRAILQSPPMGTMSGRHRLDLPAALGGMMIEADAEVTGPLGVAQLGAWDREIHARAPRAGRPAMMPLGVRYGAAPLPSTAAAQRAWRRNAPHIDVLAGTNVREAALYQDTPPFPTVQRIPGIGPLALEAAIRFLSGQVFTRPTAAFVQHHQRSGGRARRYIFHGTLGAGWGSVLPPRHPLAAAHAGELPYLFAADGWRPSALLDGTSVAEVDRLGRGMRQMWADFARTGVADDSGARDLLRLVD